VTILRYVGLAYLASWLIIGLHTWVAMRWRSFVVASAVGIAAMVVAVMAFQSDFAMWFPWTLPGLITHMIEQGQDTLPQLGVGSLGGLAVSAPTGWEVPRRDVL
jgi:hypothetical protein